MFKKVQFFGLALSLIIFGLTCFAPRALHLEFVYSLIVLMTIWSPGNRTTFDASVLLSGMIILGYFINFRKNPSETEDVVTNILPLLFIWAFTFAIIKYKESQEKLLKSTQHLDAMFKHATEGIIISNKKGEIVMANPRSLEQFGYKDIGLVGKQIELLIPDRFTPRHGHYRNEYYDELHNRPMGKGLSLFAKRRDSTEFPVEISLSSFKIKDQLYVISFIIDITERKKQEDIINQVNEELEGRVEMRTKELAEANYTLAEVNSSLQEEMEVRAKVEDALRDSQRLYSTIARNFPNGMICVIDKSMRTVFIDGKELQELNLKRDELTGMPVGSLPFWKGEPMVSDQMQKVFNWESISLDFEHNERNYSMISVPLPDAKGFVKEALIVVQNITELKNAEKEILLSLEKEKSLNEMKSKFVSIASHEFRTPLSTILSSVSLLEKYNKPEESEKRAKHIDRVKSSVKNLTEILNDFLSLEKLEGGNIEAHPSEFDLVNFSEDVKEELQIVAKPGQIINYKHEGQIREVNLDKQVLRNICFNLLNNAIKYSQEGKEIDFTTIIGDQIIVKVTDHGIGIPAEDQEHLFERFFRAANVTAIQGTGLGLNIVRRYVQLLKGNIEFSSEINKGTTFTVKIPLNTSTAV
ncbi:MAG: PAS domain S-box protein [Bacteroidetes bacterium]|nr:PAS domain S-box protein [Bacteroidota bacterium]MBL0138950.1 PAS domain S-box protein [Bacteroidota bacterium]